MERYNVIVLGAGSGGLVVAAGAAGLGARPALVEKHKMGGDCLNYGCVPSKALLRAAKAARHVRDAHRFAVRGVDGLPPQDLRAVMDYVRSRQAHIAPHDSVERFTGLGVDVVQGTARLVSEHEVRIEETGTLLWGRHIVIATGSRAKIPDIPGLGAAGYLTNETVFDLDTLPGRLLVMGGGPIGCEIGQAFRRLGSEVTIVSSTPHLLPKEDDDVAAVLLAELRREGIHVIFDARATHVDVRDGRKLVTVHPKDGGPASEIDVDAILVATGRRPNVEGLDLDRLGVAYDAGGIKTDSKCRTSVRSIWAVGDVTGPYLFTHWAGHQARVALQNILFPATATCDYANMPHVTYTEPEVATVGLTESAARRENVSHRVFKVPFEGNDRAVCDDAFEGYFGKVLADAKGRILGASILHPHAGDLLAELVLAKKYGLTLAQLSSTIHAYPSLSEINRALGDAYRKTKLTPTTKARLTRFYSWLRR